MKRISFIILLLAFLPSLQAQSEFELISQTLTDYIEGSTNGQPDRLKKAFHPDLNLYYVKNDDVAVWSGKSYILDTKEGEPTGERGKIISIDYENNAAVAKVEISHPKNPVPYIDYFMLLKTNGKWTIIHKMFTKRSTAN
ncbi:MAG: nuclear transport factor 2 family protein [Bacteroidia bacterium]|nr:nuclear transport factor 2 family protein [Bacteroidia bacterium]